MEMEMGMGMRKRRRRRERQMEAGYPTCTLTWMFSYFNTD
jgi:hypothetical protein